MADSPLHRLDPRRPFTRADALAAGISPGQLRGSRFRRVFRDVYVYDVARADPVVRVRAALALHPPSAYASHTSAACVYGVPVPALGDTHVSVFAAGDRRPRPGLVTHVVAAGAEVMVVDGVRVSAPARMFLELATLLGLVELVVVGDALVRRGRVTPAELAQASAAALVRARVDSPMETRLRLLLVLAGLPEPEVNRELRAPDGGVRYRLDLSYPDAKVAVEYDGRQHREELRQAEWDLARREWLERDGWLVLPVVASGIYRRPDRTLDRVLVALRSRGCPGVPRRLDEAWRPHFPAPG